MNGGLNQYAVYRLRRDLKETRARRHQSYQYLKAHSLKVESGYYEQLYLSGFNPATPNMELRKQLEAALPSGVAGESLYTGDVLAITREGITEAFYVDPDSLVPLAGFFHISSKSPAVTMDTTDFQIEGRSGNWFAAEETWIDGHHYFLMQSMKYGSKASYAVVDSSGNTVAEDTKVGFTDEIIRQIRESVREKGKEKALANTQISSLAPRESEKGMDTPAGIHSQDPASSLSQKEKPAIVLSESGQVSSGEQQSKKKRRKGKLPLKGRESVLKRLRKYQQMVAEQYRKKST